MEGLYRDCIGRESRQSGTYSHKLRMTAWFLSVGEKNQCATTSSPLSPQRANCGAGKRRRPTFWRIDCIDYAVPPPVAARNFPEPRFYLDGFPPEFFGRGHRTIRVLLRQSQLPFLWIYRASAMLNVRYGSQQSRNQAGPYLRAIPHVRRIAREHALLEDDPPHHERYGRRNDQKVAPIRKCQRITSS